MSFCTYVKNLLGMPCGLRMQNIASLHEILCKSVIAACKKSLLSKKLCASALKHLTQNGEGFQFGHSLKVQAVIRVDVAQESGAFVAVEVEYVHRFVAHA